MAVACILNLGTLCPNSPHRRHHPWRLRPAQSACAAAAGRAASGWMWGRTYGRGVGRGRRQCQVSVLRCSSHRQHRMAAAGVLVRSTRTPGCCDLTPPTLNAPLHYVVLLVRLAAAIHKQVPACHRGRQAAARHLQRRQLLPPAHEAGLAVVANHRVVPAAQARGTVKSIDIGTSSLLHTHKPAHNPMHLRCRMNRHSTSQASPLQAIAAACNEHLVGCGAGRW